MSLFCCSLWPIIITVAIFCIHLLYKFYSKLQKLPPGPCPIPIIGNITNLDKNAPHTTFRKWADDYGEVFTFWMGNQPCIVINSYQLLKELLIKKGDSLSHRPYNYAFQLFQHGKFGIVLNDGDDWKEQRRFALHTLRDFGFGKSLMESKINDQIEILLADMKELNNSGDECIVLDPTDLLQNCMGNIVLTIVMGSSQKQEHSSTAKLIERIMGTFGNPITQLLSVYPVLRFIPICNHFNYDIMVKLSKEYYSWAGVRIAECRQKCDFDSEPTNFVEAYFQEIEKRKNERKDINESKEDSTFTLWQLKTVIADLYIAGMETTVTTMKWAILYLIHNPEVQARVQKEIDSVIGEYVPKMSHRPMMPYTVAMIAEVQRLANVVAINMQHRSSEDLEIKGYSIPKNSILIPQMSSVHLDPEIFPDPLLFNPERFANSTGDSTVNRIEAVLPFGIGKRQCLGESLARMELFLVLCRLLQTWSIEPVDPHCLPTLEGTMVFTHVPKPYECKFVRR